jgi:hypothetical protein
MAKRLENYHVVRSGYPLRVETTRAPAAGKSVPMLIETAIGTADFADFADVKPVSFMALASDFEAIFVSKLLFIRAIRGFNSSFRA